MRRMMDARGMQVGEELKFRPLTPNDFIARLTADPAREVKISASARTQSGEAISQSNVRLVSAAAEDLAGEKQVDIADAVDMAGPGGGYSRRHHRCVAASRA